MENDMSAHNDMSIHHASYRRDDLPPISVSAHDYERLRRLADASAGKFPRTADFLSRELDRAQIVGPLELLPGSVMMGSEVTFRDDTAGTTRTVTLVYPEDADIDLNRISVLTPVGAALIGLSVSQSIEWRTHSGEWRSLTVLAVHQAPPSTGDSGTVADAARP
jgi:regulator of nucleoside diphosphate kinase